MRLMTPVVFSAIAILSNLGCKTKSSEPVVAAPTQAGAAAPMVGNTLAGKVLERLDASPYCYLRIQTANGEVWAAVPEAKIEKGADVTIAEPALMTNFESKTLGRTFPQVYFGNLAPAGAAGAAASGDPHGQAAAAPVEVGKVEKATGAEARTVGELWSQKAALKGKTVVVRGKVVRYSAGVMGKNWMHLQDGSGDAAKHTHDVTVTTLDNVAKGDTVTVRGVLTLDKDLGSGYNYPVIIEDAKVQKK